MKTNQIHHQGQQQRGQQNHPHQQGQQRREHRPPPVQPGLVSVFSALKMACKDAGEPEPLPPMTRRQWAKMQDHCLIWQHPDFGKLEIHVQGLQVRDVQAEGDSLWGEIYFTRKRDDVVLEFKSELKDGVSLMRCKFRKGGHTTSNVVSGPLEPHKTDIKWGKPESAKDEQHLDDIPQTHLTEDKDIAFVFMNSEGKFIQIEIAVRSVARKLWLTCQEMYCGHVVRTTLQKAANLATTVHRDGGFATFVAPLYSENAYPGADYIKNFGLDVILHALERNVTVPMHKATIAEWQQSVSDIPADLKARKWIKGTVSWFNLSYNGGSGFIVCEDGKSCFIHSLQILNANGKPLAFDGQLPILPAGSCVALRWHEDKDGPHKGKRKATALQKVVGIHTGGLQIVA